MTQTGGVFAINGNVGSTSNNSATIGSASGEASSYSLSGGSLSVPNGITAIGWAGTGVMTISGGTANM